MTKAEVIGGLPEVFVSVGIVLDPGAVLVHWTPEEVEAFAEGDPEAEVKFQQEAVGLVRGGHGDLDGDEIELETRMAVQRALREALAQDIDSKEKRSGNGR